MEFITHWIENNPEYSGLIVFAITFIETFAFIGALVPGVVVLFAASALIGGSQSVGLLPLILIAGVSTAISNSLSFFWGYSLRHRIEHIPFLVRHKSVLDRSEVFFNKWGPLSIMIGRFIGPVRPFVAFAAGSLSFAPKRFVLFDVLAIAVWAPVYVVPGYLAGMAVDGFIPSWDKWPALMVLSIISTFALIIFIAGNYWLQVKLPLAKRIAAKIGVDELPLASLLLLLVILSLFVGVETPFPLDESIRSGFQQLIQPWGFILSGLIFELSSKTLLALQCSLITIMLLLSHQFRAAFLIAIISIAALYQPSTYDIAYPDFSLDIAVFSLLIGSMTAIFCESIKPAKRWFLYLFSIVLIFIHSTASLTLGIYSLTQVVLGLYLGVGTTAAVRICYSFLRIRNYRHTPIVWPLGTLLILTTTSYLLV